MTEHIDTLLLNMLKRTKKPFFHKYDFSGKEGLSHHCSGKMFCHIDVNSGLFQASEKETTECRHCTSVLL